MALNDLLNQRGGLAERLRHARRTAGLTGAALAERLGWVRSKVSKIETGNQLPTPSDVRDWSQACGIPDAITHELLDLLADVSSEHRQWQHRLRRGGETGLQTGVDELVRSAHLVKNFETFLLPGLVQTAGYARFRETENSRLHGFSEDAIDDRVAARMRRQDVLHEPGRHFTFVVLEYALRPLLTPPDVMLGQLDRLLSLAGLPTVTFGVVPVDRLPFNPVTGFLLLDDSYVVVESFAASIRAAGDEATAYVGVMDALLKAALTGDDATRFILAAARELRDQESS